jgi:hypothetical protein
MLIGPLELNQNLSPTGDSVIPHDPYSNVNWSESFGSQLDALDSRLAETFGWLTLKLSTTPHSVAGPVDEGFV